jgi:lipopolysaccharide biosynthesis glycosyltransferase
MKVIFAADANFFPGLQVSLASLKKDLAEDAACTVDVLHSGLNEPQMRSLRRVASGIGFDPARIHFVDIDSYDFEGVKTIRGSKMTYARMLIPELYPDESEVVYCDCDILFIRGIAELRSADLGESFVAASQDATVVVMRNDCAWEDVPAASLDQPYFNAGLMKLNLKAWRACRVGERALEVAKRDPEKCTYWDQTILNYLCVGKVRFVDPENNLQFRSPDALLEPSRINIHFIGAKKPWIVHSAAEDFRLWRKAYREHVSRVPLYALKPSYWVRSLVIYLARVLGLRGRMIAIRRALLKW